LAQAVSQAEESRFRNPASLRFSCLQLQRRAMTDAKEPPEKKVRVDVPKLLYFNFPGKGECIRLAFHYGGIPFEDYRFSSREEFTKMKESGELQFGQVPALVVDGKTLTQSAAILRFVGKRAGLYPEDPVLAAHVDAIMDQEADALMGFRVTKYQERFGFGAWLMTDENVAKLRADINLCTWASWRRSSSRVVRGGWLARQSLRSLTSFGCQRCSYWRKGIGMEIPQS